MYDHPSASFTTYDFIPLTLEQIRDADSIVVSRKYAEDIETKGLRCKSSSYRKYPKRVYLYASDKPLNKIPDIDKFIKLVTSPYDRRDYGLIVYRIDLSKMTTKTHINFYTDDCMKEENAVYTYNNIPPECITKIEYELK